MRPLFHPSSGLERCRERRRLGFTLIEATLSTIIIGVGGVAMIELLGAGTMANNESTQLTTAINLAGNIRETMAGMHFADPNDPTHWGREDGESTVGQFNDIDDFDGQTLCPPVDAGRGSLGSDYLTWSQVIAVESVRPDNLAATMSHMTLDPESRPTSRITVTILHNGVLVYAESWLAAYADPSGK